jgi:type III secretion protein C
MAPQALLDMLSRTYGFFWFYDGNSLIVSPVSDVKIEMVRLAPDALNNLTSTLQRLGVYDPRYPIRVDGANRLVVLSGPSRYVEMMSSISRALQDSAEQKAPTEVLVYPLKYAWAEDRSLPSGDSAVVIPGVVSVMRGIYGQADDRVTVRNSATLTRPRARRSVAGGTDRDHYGFYEKVADESQANTVRETMNQVLQTAAVRGAVPPQQLPVIVADARRNAVVVRDVADRLARHKALIQELDKRAALVEIEARIVDVRSEAVESLGVDWNISGHRAALQINSGGADAPLRATGSLATDPIDATAPKGGRFTVMAGSTAQFLLSRIRALEQEGKARIVGTPRVTTLDNVQSVMSSKEVFYVKVPGAYASNLFEVSAGVSLTVQPFVIHDDDGTSVRIAVNITDGSVDKTRQVEGIPLTTQSEINAEAIVKEGASLLVAGYVREEESSGKSGVPILSSLPGVGGLFRETTRNSVRQERFFLLTPRIVTP